MIHPRNNQPEIPPEKIRVLPNAEGGESVWRIDPQANIDIMTFQNNVGIVRMPCVRVELELWRLPARIIQVDCYEVAPPQGTGGPLARLFRKELNLR